MVLRLYILMVLRLYKFIHFTLCKVTGFRLYKALYKGVTAMLQQLVFSSFMSFYGFVSIEGWCAGKQEGRLRTSKEERDHVV